MQHITIQLNIDSTLNQPYIMCGVATKSRHDRIYLSLLAIRVPQSPIGRFSISLFFAYLLLKKEARSKYLSVSTHLEHLQSLLRVPPSRISTVLERQPMNKVKLWVHWLPISIQLIRLSYSTKLAILV